MAHDYYLLRPLYPLGALAGMAYWRDSVDVFHCHHLPSAGWVGALCGRLLRRPTVVKVVGGEPAGDLATLRRELLGPLKLRAVRQATRVVALSRQIRAELLAVGFPQHQLCDIPNGVDLAEFPLRPDHAWPRGHGAHPASAPARLLYVGRLSPEKQIEVLIEAQARLPPPRPTLHVVGDGPARGALQDLAARAGLAQDVVFRGVARGELAEHYHAADVLVHPSGSEGLSNVVLEAMATGLPVVASSIGGHVDLVRDGVTGWTFPPGDAAALAAVLARVMAAPAARRRCAAAARRRVVASYSIESVARRYLDLYRELLAGWRPPSA